MLQDVGSLEAGKIAEFLVLTSNPLEKIENSLNLKCTVKGGGRTRQQHSRN
jgi:imidazolonepropionase-like amidohydrolase